MFTKLIFLCSAGFVAAFVDSIAGGGGLISVPAFLAAGIPTHLTLGTNKFSASSGSFTSSLKFILSKKANFNLLKYLIPFTLIGASIGVNTVMLIDENILKSLILVLILCVGLYSMFSKSLGGENKFEGLTKKNIALGIIISFSLGFYDGFFGPGTGSFLMFLLIKVYKFDFTNAAGNARVLNFVSNITSLVLFAFKGQIIYTLAIPVGIFMALGARLGSGLAIKNGSKLIKPIFSIVSLCVAGKILWDIIV